MKQLIPIIDPICANEKIVGNKAKNLHLLAKNRFTIPHTFVALAANLNSDELNYLEKLNWQSFCLRSSSSSEDSQHTAAAGKFYSGIDKSAAEINPELKKVFGSFANNLGVPATGAAIVQETIRGELSGVAFLQDNELIVEYTEGFAGDLVGGLITPKRTILTEKTADFYGIYNLTQQLVSIFSSNIDIEWTIQGGEIYLLQVRPITASVRLIGTKKNYHNLKEVYAANISLSDLIKKYANQSGQAFIEEDQGKLTRLRDLNQLIGLPFENRTTYKLNELCKIRENFTPEPPLAARLIPKSANLDKKRTRGLNVDDTINWIIPNTAELTLDYEVELSKHSDNPEFSVIGNITKESYELDLVEGGAHQLTQGFIQAEKVNHFFCDLNGYKNLPEKLKKVIHFLEITAAEIKVQLAKKFAVKTNQNNHLICYFEYGFDKKIGPYFIDVSFSLNKLLKTPVTAEEEFLGEICLDPAAATTGSLMILEYLTPEIIYNLPQVRGIIVAKGGYLSHGAIVCRERQIPYRVDPELFNQITKLSEHPKSNKQSRRIVLESAK